MLLALSVHLLNFVDERFAADPIVHGDGCKAMADSVHRLLGGIKTSNKVRPAERDLLARLRNEIVTDRTAHFSSVRSQIKQLVDDLVNDTSG